MTAAGVARGLGVSAPQAQEWLNRLVKEETLEKTKRPVRYLARQISLFEGEGATETIARMKSGESRR
jgi:hypothetical protein